MMAGTDFYHPMTLSFDELLWLLLPLCASLSITYKAIRTESLRRLPLEVLTLFCYLVIGLLGLGTGLWLVQTYCL